MAERFLLINKNSLRLELERAQHWLEVLLHSLTVVVVGGIKGETIIVLVMQDRKDGEVIRQAVGIREACILRGPWHPSHRELRIGGSDGVQVLDILISPERIDISLVDVLNSRAGERSRRDTFAGQIEAESLLRLQV